MLPSKWTNNPCESGVGAKKKKRKKKKEKMMMMMMIGLITVLLD